MKVSVIIPCYNLQDHIEKCLKSLTSQEYKNLEVICVDDGSTDDTLNIIKSFKSESKLDFHIIEQENKGACSARNSGLRKATGMFVQFLDGDDQLQADKISLQLKQAQSENSDLVIGSYKRINEKGLQIQKNIYKNEDDFDPWLGLMKGNLGITSSNLFKRALFESGIKWNEELKSSQEYELMFNLLKDNPRVSFNSNLSTIILVRKQGSISKANVSEKWKRYVELRVSIKNYLSEHPHNCKKEDINQILFEAIRMYYPYNCKEAKISLKNSLPKSFKPRVSEICSPAYVKLYQIFGFSMSEKIKSLISPAKKEH